MNNKSAIFQSSAISSFHITSLPKTNMKRTILKDENGRGYEESLRIDIERDSAKSIATSSNAENVNVITTNPENLESSFENIKKGYNDLRLMNERSIGIGCKLRFTCHFISKSNLN